MPESNDPVRKHYGRGQLAERFWAALVEGGIDPDQLTSEDLANFDAFHSRGRRSTEELAEKIRPASGDRILDVGCGIGGTARYLAETFHCKVTGIDLTDEYIELATLLTDQLNCQAEVDFVQGTAIDLPAADDHFDVVWTEHALMNVREKLRAYREMKRVLKRSGRLAFHDVFAETGDPAYPLPWADTASISFLQSQHTVRSALEQIGFEVDDWQDCTEVTVDAFKQLMQRIEAGSSPPGIRVFMGDDAALKIGNYLNGLERGNLSVAMGTARLLPGLD